MNIWKRASVALKDGTSLIAADDLLKAAVVKATNHDEYSVDPENALFIYRHVRATPASLKPLISAISSRVTRTRSWVVALKGLMLMHGFFLSKTTAAESIGRLPFDLSAFGREGNSRSSRSGGFSLFVRAYFAFLDRRSILFHDGNRHRYDEESSVMIRLVIIRKMQVVIDSLIRIKPIGESSVRIPVINEAMENVISEILEIYGWICRRIAEVLPNVSSKSGKRQADVALKIVAKSMTQAEELVKYFVFCRDLGVANAQEIPDFVRIPVDDVIHLHEIVWTDKEKEQGKAEEERDECGDSEERTKCVEGEGEEEEEEEEMERQLVSEIDDLIKLDDEEEKEEEVEKPSPAPPVVEVPDLISL